MGNCLDDEEEWRDLYRYPNYQVSSHGRVRSLNRTLYSPIKRGNYITYKGKILSLWSNKGYPYTAIQENYEYVHKLVCETFFCGPIKENQTYVNHIDFVITNNHWSNLEWTSNQENIIHTYKYGKGAKTCRFTREQVLEIRELRASSNMTYKQIGKLYNVGASHICQIVHKQIWGYLDDTPT